MTKESKEPQVGEAERVARAFTEAKQRRDKKALMDLISEDIDHQVPFSESGRVDEGGFRHHRGKAQMGPYFDNIVSNVGEINLVDLMYQPASDGRTVFLEGFTEAKMANGENYKNRFICRYEIENGKIVSAREYHNPVAAAIAFKRPVAGQILTFGS